MYGPAFRSWNSYYLPFLNSHPESWSQFQLCANGPLSHPFCHLHRCQHMACLRWIFLWSEVPFDAYRSPHKYQTEELYQCQIFHPCTSPRHNLCCYQRLHSRLQMGCLDILPKEWTMILLRKVTRHRKYNKGIIAHYHNLGISGKTSRMLGRIPTFKLIIIKAHIVKVVVLFFSAVTE